jgi:signal transduction histidine kinase
MSPDQLDAYFGRDAAAFARSGAPAQACAVLALHAGGRLSEALELIRRQRAAGGWPGEPFAALMEAEQTLLCVKLGVELPPVDRACLRSCPAAALVYEYASYVHLFWINHRKAWAALLRLLWLSLRVRRSGMLTTALFLIGHMMALGGWTRAGYTISCWTFLRIESRRARTSRFSTSLVFALFPYTTLVRGRLDYVDQVLRRCQAGVPRDPFYLTLFALGGLYAAAYSGDVVRADILASYFDELHRRSGLQRYRLVAQLMPLLPLALRGYSNLVADEFDRVTGEHDPAANHPLINSQLYRASALIALCLGQFDRAGRYIAHAIDYRKRSGSFQAWRNVDATIQNLAASHRPLDPSHHNFFGGSLRLAPPSTLGTFLIEAIHALPTAFSSVTAFEERVAELLGKHVDCPAQLQDQSARFDENVCQIRIGARYIVFRQVPRARLPLLEQVLATVAPVLTILERTVHDLVRLKEENVRISQEAAVARTTQMLAHDVRRPFKVLEMAMDAMRRAHTPDELRSAVHELLPEVDRATAHVDGLLADVMEIGSAAPLRIEPVLPESLILDCLRDLLRIHPDADPQIEYRLSEPTLVAVEPRRIARAISNILTNAIQSLGSTRQIWIGISVVDDRWVEVLIGNSGSRIAEQDLLRVFDAFYTKGKPSGTGLGLAIAKRVVLAHGGRIWCTSTEGVGVEFRFTLPRELGAQPSATEVDRVRGELPRSIRELAAARPAVLLAVAPPQSPALPQIALVDDSRAFLRGWQAVLRESATLVYFRSPDAFWKAAEDDARLVAHLSAVITDYRFDDSIETGLTFASRLRLTRPDLPLFLSSSGAFSERELHDAVDGVLDKRPIPWPQLQALIAAARNNGCGAQDVVAK